MLQFKKSSNPDFSNYNIANQLDLLLKEQRNQRLDLANINALVKQLLVDRNLQKQVDEYFEDDSEVPTETTKGVSGVDL